jgi:hypothetical protein
MATLVSTPVRAVADGFVHSCGYKSAVLSGIVPDERHKKNGGYHCSVDDLKAHGNGGDYSNTRPDDKNLNIQYGAAFDVTMSGADMVKSYKRVHAVWADKGDPRRKYINCVNTWDGSGDAVRLDFVVGTAKYASPDHKWHVHGELRRRYLGDPKAARAYISMLKGEAKATWIAREEKPAAAVKPAPAKPVVKPKPAAKRVPGSRVLSYTPGKTVLRGDDVAFVQRFIGPAKAGPADGVAGAKFRAAAIWYQKLRGLKADGIVGAATWEALGVRNSL